MKKISINILCVLLIVILSASVLFSLWGMASSFMQGFSDGWSSKQSEYHETGVPVPVVIDHSNNDITDITASPDSLLLDSGKVVHCYPKVEYLVVEDSDASGYLLIAEVILGFITLVLLVFLIIQFIRFVININRGEIFVEKNIRILYRFSIYLLCISVAEILSGLGYDFFLSSEHLSVNGSVLQAYWAIPWGDLLFALLSLLIAKIWKQGMDMEEEHKLII